MRSSRLRAAAIGTLLVFAFVGAAAQPLGAQLAVPRNVVVVPEADKFVPFVTTIHAGEVVIWVNKDTDDHTVVSDDAFNTVGPRGLDHLLPGTVTNHGKAGVFALRFRHPGTFVYYCRFHAHLDGDNQPVAPGPDGGIQDAQGNFGTPMMGIVIVRPAGENDNNNND